MKILSYSRAAHRSVCYGKYWTCPPGVGDWRLLESRYKGYTHCFVYSTRHELEDSFDVDGMHQGRLDHNTLDHAIHSFFAEKEISFAQLGTEGCSRCKVCTYPDAPCRFPDQMSPSVEACGIDVVSLSAHCHAAAPQGKDTVRLQSTGEIGTLSVSSTYSDLDLSLGNAEKVTLAGAEGDIFLRGRGVSATETSTSRGKTQIYLQSYESIDAQSYTGAIDLTLPEALGFSLTVLPNGGARPKNVSVNFEGAVQNGDSFTVKDGGGTITVKTGGNLDVTPF